MTKEKYDHPHPDTKDAFEAKIAEIGLDTVMNITVLVDDKLKKDIYKVSKCSPSENFKTGDDINIYLNEDIFIQLPEKLQTLTIVEALAGISYNYDKEAVEYTKPDFYAYSGVMEKHSYDDVVVLRESIKSLFDKAKQAADEARALAKSTSNL
jgi:hypothetical protein